MWNELLEDDLVFLVEPAMVADDENVVGERIIIILETYRYFFLRAAEVAHLLLVCVELVEDCVPIQFLLSKSVLFEFAS